MTRQAVIVPKPGHAAASKRLWNDEDDAILITMMRDSVPRDEIATKLGRTISGILNRYYKLMARERTVSASLAAVREEEREVTEPTKPRGHGKLWTSSDDKILLDLVDRNVPRTTIATTMHRTKDAVDARISLLRRGLVASSPSRPGQGRVQDRGVSMPPTNRRLPPSQRSLGKAERRRVAQEAPPRLEDVLAQKEEAARIKNRIHYATVTWTNDDGIGLTFKKAMDRRVGVKLTGLGPAKGTESVGPPYTLVATIEVEGEAAYSRLLTYIKDKCPDVSCVLEVR